MGHMTKMAAMLNYGKTPQKSQKKAKQGYVLTLTQGHLNIKIKIMVFSEITGFGNYCSLRPGTLQMQTIYEVNKGL